MSMHSVFLKLGNNPALFDGLKIARERELCEEYMGKFPVISISLKSVDGRSFRSASVALRTVIGDEARRFECLRFSTRLSEDDKEAYAQLTEVGSAQGGVYTMTEDIAAASLKTLSRLLEKHYEKKSSC